MRERYDRAAESMNAQGVFGLTLLTAVYTAASPWIVGFDAMTRLAVTDLIVGLCVTVLALGFASALDRTHGMTWTLPIFGVWLIIAPWIAGDVAPTSPMIWSNVIAGVVLTFLGLTAGYFGMRARGSASHTAG
ncbi:MAG TPA: SPW repeat protein [Mycobacterium sp.]|nr:SPW repeat protein [Mycobacterium sp.]